MYSRDNFESSRGGQASLPGLCFEPQQLRLPLQLPRPQPKQPPLNPPANACGLRCTFSSPYNQVTKIFYLNELAYHKYVLSLSTYYGVLTPAVDTVAILCGPNASIGHLHRDTLLSPASHIITYAGVENKCPPSVGTRPI